MTLTGYVTTFLVTCTLGLSVALAWAVHANNELRSELGASEQAVLQLVETTTSNRQQILQLIREVEECANKRAAAEQSALRATQELHRRATEINTSTNTRVREIEDEVEANPPCDCTVPPRTTRLLIDAACRANRDTNCP